MIRGLVIVMYLIGCDQPRSSHSSENGRASEARDRSKNQSQTKKRNPSSIRGKSGDAVEEEGDGNEEGKSKSQTESGKASRDGIGGDNDAKARGKEFFRNTLSKTFTENCKSCHADPRENPPRRGPLSIFSYDSMRKMLEVGFSSLNNRLAHKTRNFEAHEGGSQCKNGPTASPCSEISEWWRIEFGEDSQLDGGIESVSITGVVRGFAVDANNTGETVRAKVIIDEKTEFPVNASVDGGDSNYPGAHGFIFSLPAAICDGKEHSIQLVVKDKKLSSSMKFTSYSSKAAGRSYFTSTVEPALRNRCSNCHSITYENQYIYLLNPAPHQGGNATNNLLISAAVGMNDHGGGNICGDINASPCNLMQTWWSMEFGP